MSRLKEQESDEEYVTCSEDDGQLVRQEVGLCMIVVIVTKVTTGEHTTTQYKQ